MEELDIDALMKALDNDENKGLLKLNPSDIKTIKNDVLQQVGISGEQLKDYHKKLKTYRFVDELDDIKFGSYIRWINLTNPESIKLCNGGIVVSMTMSNDDICLTCRNNRNRLFKLKMNNVMIFQKMTHSELLLLQVMDYLNKGN